MCKETAYDATILNYLRARLMRICTRYCDCACTLLGNIEYDGSTLAVTESSGSVSADVLILEAGLQTIIKQQSRLRQVVHEPILHNNGSSCVHSPILFHQVYIDQLATSCEKYDLLQATSVLESVFADKRCR